MAPECGIEEVKRGEERARAGMMAAGHAEPAPPPRGLEASVEAALRSRDRPAAPRGWACSEAAGAVRSGSGACESPGPKPAVPPPPIRGRPAVRALSRHKTPS